MQIAHLIGDLGFGGAQRQLLLQLTHRANLDVRQQVLTWRDETGHHGIRSQLPEGVRQLHLPKHSRVDPVWLGRLVGHLRDDPPDILHCWLNPASHWGSLAARLAGVPALVTSEFVADLPDWRRAVHRLSSAVITDSQAVYRRLPASSRRLIPPAVEPAREGEIAVLTGRVVLCVGGIHPVKNQLLLVEALRDTEDHLVLLGPVRDREYAAQVRALAGGNVTFIDAVQDPRPFFRRADLLVLPSLSESAPNVVLEAMAYGCSVVASAVGDVPVMLDQGRLGRLVEPGNVRALRTAIADPICGEDGPAWVQKEYSVEAMVGHVESLYSQVLS